jgi:hypothetical protein
MDGFKLQHKQIQSFQMSDMAMRGDLPNRLKFPGPLTNTNQVIQNFPKVLNTETQDNTITSITGLPSGSFKWSGGCYYKGFIYAAPCVRNTILKINTNNNTWSEITGAPTIHRTFTLGSNDIIYSSPNTTTGSILRLDPKTDRFTLQAIGQNGFYGQAIAPNGKIYCAPLNNSQVLVIDSVSDSYYYIDLRDTTANKYISVVLAGDYLYFIPFNVSQILRISWKDDNWNYIPTQAGTNKWFSGIYCNGAVYFSPYNNGNILKIENDNSQKLIPLGFTPFNGWIGAHSIDDRYVVFTPYTETRYIILDTWSDTFTLVSGFPAGSNKALGSVLAENGQIYSIPHELTSVQIFKSKLVNNIDINQVMNKQQSAI